MKCNSSKFDGFEMRKCNNPAKKDGFCMVHHPESVKRREAREAEKFAARKENSIFTKYDRVVQQRDDLLAALKIISADCPHVEYDPDCTATGNADDAYNHGAEMARSAIGEQLRAAIAKAK